MRVFISWSGKQSHQIALALKEWLPSVIQALDPWVSSADIDKGEGWFASIYDSLIRSDGMGIFCLTQDNLQAPWMAFEAGALAVHDRGRVATFLHGVRPDALKPPLSLFQATNSAERSDVYKLLESLNSRLNPSLPEVRLRKAFDGNWESFEKELAQIRDGASKKATEPDQKELLHEILATVRRIEKDANKRPGGDEQQSGPDGGAPRGPTGPQSSDSGGILGLLRSNSITAASLRESLRPSYDADNLRSMLSPSTERIAEAVKALNSVDANASRIRAILELTEQNEATLNALRDAFKESDEMSRARASSEGRFAKLVQRPGGNSESEKKPAPSSRPVTHKGRKS